MIAKRFTFQYPAHINPLSIDTIGQERRHIELRQLKENINLL